MPPATFSPASGWFLFSLLCGMGVDALTQYLLGKGAANVWQINFWGNALQFCILLATQGKKLPLPPPLSKAQAVRSVLYSISSFLWFWSLRKLSLVTTNIFSLSLPFWTLWLSSTLLRERVPLRAWLVSLVGLVALLPLGWNRSLGEGVALLGLLGSLLGYASLDLLQKKMVDQEPVSHMLFYGALTGCLFAMLVGGGSKAWEVPSATGLCGAGGVALFELVATYALLRAFAQSPLHALVPYRYIVFFVAIFLDWFLFNRIPTGYELTCFALLALTLLVHSSAALTSQPRTSEEEH